MEQKLIICGITERIDMGSHNYSARCTYIPVEEMKAGDTYVAYECDGQPNPNDSDDTVHLKWLLTIDNLTDDALEFTLDNRNYTLNRRWQVLGTISYGIPNAYIHESLRLILFFATDEGSIIDYDQLKKLGQQMEANADKGDLWKNIPLAREAMHLLKDKRKGIDDEQAKMLDDKDVPRLYLSYLDYYHYLWGSTYYDDNCTYHILRVLDPNLSDTDFLANERSYRRLAFDPIQRTAHWEKEIYDVEKEVDELLKDEPRHMGFCHHYWAVKREILEKHGIEWRSPAAMNPRTNENIKTKYYKYDTIQS